MKNILLSALIATGLVTTTIAALLVPTSAPAVAESGAGELKIYCGTAADPSSKSTLPATLASVGQSEPTVLIIWKSEAFQKFSPQRRCEIVSPKFQVAIESGRSYVTSGKNPTSGVGIICAVATQEESCTPDKMLFTLKSYQSADVTVEQLSNIIYGKTSEPIYQSSGGKYVADLRALARRK